MSPSKIRQWVESLRTRRAQERPETWEDIDARWWKEGSYAGLFRGEVPELLVDRNDLSGVLRIHARAMKDVGEQDRPGLLISGHAWLEYRGRRATITFCKQDFVYRDTEHDLCGEAVREKAVTHDQGKLLLDTISRRARIAIERGSPPKIDPLGSAKFAALIWRVVTGEALRSEFKGFFNNTTLAVAIERMNARDRLVGFGANPFRRITTSDGKIVERSSDNDDELERER